MLSSPFVLYKTIQLHQMPDRFRKTLCEYANDLGATYIHWGIGDTIYEPGDLSLEIENWLVSQGAGKETIIILLG